MHTSLLTVAIALCVVASTVRAQQPVTVPLTADRWTASDTLRFETHLGRPSLYINQGIALVRDVALRDGTFEFDMTGNARSTFFGAAFHALTVSDAEVIMFRPRDSGNDQAVQYAPALNGAAAAWQIYHGPGSNAVAMLPRDEWIHVRLVLAGDVARLYLRDDTLPTLVVPRLAGVAGTQLGVWGSAYGRGAWFSEIRYTATSTTLPTTPAPPPPRGTIVDWELSNALDAPTLTPGALPSLGTLHWDRARAEPEGWVLVNRLRRQPNVGVPFDASTRTPLVDSIVGARVAGTRVVFARATIDAARDERRRMHLVYSDGALVYLNGVPLFSGMNPQNLNDGLGIMQREGQTVYLPLRKGRNELVIAVTEYTGGWAFGARLDDAGR